MFWLCVPAKLEKSWRFNLSQRDYWLDRKLVAVSKSMMGMAQSILSHDKAGNSWALLEGHGIHCAILIKNNFSHLFVQLRRPTHSIVILRAFCKFVFCNLHSHLESFPEFVTQSLMTPAGCPLVEEEFFMNCISVLIAKTLQESGHIRLTPLLNNKNRETK